MVSGWGRRPGLDRNLRVARQRMEDMGLRIGVLLALLLSGCATVPSPSSGPTRSGEPTASPTPSQAHELGPVLPGVDAEQAIAHFAAFGLDCERVGGRPYLGTEGARCRGVFADANAKVIVGITFWPDDDAVFRIVGATRHFGPFTAQITYAFRARWLSHLAAMPYESADPSAAEPWLTSNTFEDCNRHGGCSTVIGAARISYYRGRGKSDEFAFESALLDPRYPS